MDSLIRVDGDGPTSILIDRSVWAMFQAIASNQGRDWRRIKREARKAEKKARSPKVVVSR